MKSKFSKTWNSSIQPRKQRKYRFNAPINTRVNFLSVNLSKELRAKYGTRNVKLRTGDKVKVLRGKFKSKEGTVEEINTKKMKIFISKIEITKKEGSKVKVPQNPTNLQIIELKLDDKKRKEKLAKFKGSDQKPVSKEPSADSGSQKTDNEAK